MIPVIDPVPAARLAEELEGRPPLATFRGLEVHSFRGDECPYAMREVGRLRELGFRAAGAGRNVACDLDDLDFGPSAYRQLVAWDGEMREIVGVYRYQVGRTALDRGDEVLRTSSLFRYTEAFDEAVKPSGIELGRSVVNARARRRKLGFFALWTGLRALVDHHPGTRFYFGNVSLYENLGAPVLEGIVAFLERHYAPPAPMLEARAELRFVPGEGARRQAAAFRPEGSRDGVRDLRSLVEAVGGKVPAILPSYLGVARDIWFGETAVDPDFGGALEIGVVIPVAAAERSRALDRFAPAR